MCKQIEKTLGLFILLSIIPMLAFADASADSEVPSIGRPEFEGNGCPDADSIAFVRSPDGNELSVLFENFTVSTSATKKFGLSKCKITVPVDVPNGIMVTLLGVDHRGIAYIPEGGRGLFSRQYSISGKKARKFINSVEAKDEFYEFVYEDSSKVVAKSKCGENIVTQVNTTLMVQKPTYDSTDATMSLFSEDWDMNILFKFKSTECEEDK